jgi:sensor histidine kinase YesM
MSMRVIAGVCGLWLLIGLVWASQLMLGANLEGSSLPASAAIQSALVQTLPWIPVTLAVIAVTAQYPITRAKWKRTAWIHVVAFVVLAYAANVLVVLAFWITQGQFNGMEALLRGGAYWTAMRAHIAALVYIAIAALTQGILYYRASRRRELDVARMEGQLARARLDALVAQIRPHFLFNTLHTIGHLWRSGRNDDADAMLDHLGSLFHRVQQSTARTLITLDEELDTVEAYLAIEEARFGDRLRVVIDVPDDARACAVPPLLLQPIVENAIRHGIAPSSDAGFVRVSAGITAGTLTLLVEDDGPGPSSSPSSAGTGTGLETTRQRIRQMFGEAGRLSIEPLSPHGTRVSITLPERETEAGERPRGAPPVHVGSGLG